jgi:aspartyl-tRNA(Asn)/glutamyl-tRNA(Gln) amidotransferase subunit B
MSLSLVDLNRAGTPLLEIVSGPDLRGTAEASAYLQALRRVLRFAGVSECDMEKGSFRCDANVSLRPAGARAFGTRTEIKNLNSFKFVAQALQAEIDRQAAVLERGERVLQETMAFDPDSGRTAAMRSKEEANDYRYFPEPDLPSFQIDPAWVESLRRALPEDPGARLRRFVERLGLPRKDAEALLAERPLADYFEATLKAGVADAPDAANWILTDVLRLANEKRLPVAGLAVTPQRLAGLVQLVAGGQLSVQAGRSVISAMEAKPGLDAEAVARELDLLQVSDSGELQQLVARVIERERDLVERYRGGKTGVFNALLGAVMKDSGGRANPNTVRELLRSALG